MERETLTSAETARYARHLMLPEIGQSGQEKLKAGRVLVIGAGGLGCPVLQYLVAAGVGTIGIIDSDRVEASNLQRQILFSPADEGQLKATVAAEKLSRQNPLVHVQAYPTRLTADNALALLANYDLVLDGSDNFATRYLVNDACVMLNKPLVFGSIYKFEGQVSVFNYQDGPTYRCLYPEASELASCAEVGVLGVLPGLVGCLMTNEAIKILTGIGEVATGKLLVFDALSLSFNHFSLALNPANKQIHSLSPTTPGCATPVREIDGTELLQRLQHEKGLLVIDVRETAEYLQYHIGGTNIPLSLLPEHLPALSPDKPVVIHCQGGFRSQQAVRFLNSQGYPEAYSLRGGLAALSPATRAAIKLQLEREVKL